MQVLELAARASLPQLCDEVPCKGKRVQRHVCGTTRRQERPCPSPRPPRRTRDAEVAIQVVCRQARVEGGGASGRCGVGVGCGGRRRRTGACEHVWLHGVELTAVCRICPRVLFTLEGGRREERQRVGHCGNRPLWLAPPRGCPARLPRAYIPKALALRPAGRPGSGSTRANWPQGHSDPLHVPDERSPVCLQRVELWVGRIARTERARGSGGRDGAAGQGSGALRTPSRGGTVPSSRPRTHPPAGLH